MSKLNMSQKYEYVPKGSDLVIREVIKNLRSRKVAQIEAAS
jgi:hypothetical protein